MFDKPPYDLVKPVAKLTQERWDALRALELRYKKEHEKLLAEVRRAQNVYKNAEATFSLFDRELSLLDSMALVVPVCSEHNRKILIDDPVYRKLEKIAFCSDPIPRESDNILNQRVRRFRQLMESRRMSEKLYNKLSLMNPDEIKSLVSITSDNQILGLT